MNIALGATSAVAMVSPNFLQVTAGGHVWGLNFREPEAAETFAKRIEVTIAQVSDAPTPVASDTAGAARPKQVAPSSSPTVETASSMMAKFAQLDKPVATKPAPSSDPNLAPQEKFESQVSERFFAFFFVFGFLILVSSERRDE